MDTNPCFGPLLVYGILYSRCYSLSAPCSYNIVLCSSLHMCINQIDMYIRTCRWVNVHVFTSYLDLTHYLSFIPYSSNIIVLLSSYITCTNHMCSSLRIMGCHSVVSRMAVSTSVPLVGRVWTLAREARLTAAAVLLIALAMLCCTHSMDR